MAALIVELLACLVGCLVSITSLVSDLLSLLLFGNLAGFSWVESDVFAGWVGLVFDYSMGLLAMV